MLPDWAPNVHPLIVHFPIALLFAAFAVDVVSVAWRLGGIRIAAVALYVAGAVGAAASYVTGNQAAESVTIPTEAIAAVNEHQDAALLVLIFFGIYATLRFALVALRVRPSVAVHALVTLLAGAGLYLVWLASESGGRLVFQYGIGVLAVETLTRELEDRSGPPPGEDAGPIEGEAGGWTWHIRPRSAEAFAAGFTFIEGSPDQLHVAVADTEDGDVLVLHPTGSPVMFVTGGALDGVDLRAVLDASDLAGSVTLVHNVQDERNYHFLRLGTRLAQGRVVAGREEILASGDRRVAGWTTIRATGNRGHFYAYEDGRTVAHGHSAQPAAGRAGLRIEGTGELRLRHLEARAVQ
jgi:uncharacterized membrane protein